MRYLSKPDRQLRPANVVYLAEELVQSIDLSTIHTAWMLSFKLARPQQLKGLARKWKVAEGEHGRLVREHGGAEGEHERVEGEHKGIEGEQKLERGLGTGALWRC